MSELSKVYNQYQGSLVSSQREYEERLKTHAKYLKDRYQELLHEFVASFSQYSENQMDRLEVKRIAEQFFETTEIAFVAIDGSCHKQQSANFISFFGGAYGSKGIISLSEPTGKIRYQRWELNRDVSMVAFVPIPPDVMHIVIDEDDAESPTVMADSEVADVSSLHTKMMQLAEIYLAYELAKSSSVEAPRIIMIDNSIGGILGNTSFSPKHLSLDRGSFEGETISKGDMQIALAHPFNQKLGIPSTKNFQPHFRVIAEAVWQETKTITGVSCNGFPEKHFRGGAQFLERLGIGSFDKDKVSFTFNEDPRASWQKTVRTFERICEKLFRAKDPFGVTYELKAPAGEREYFRPRDVMFLVGVGLRALIETCWKRKILLTGIVKDSSSRFFYRNFLGSVCAKRALNPAKHLALPLTDRSIAELLPNLSPDLKAPWATLEFDSCFMTLHPEPKNGVWKIKGYDHPTYGETTRPERMTLRSLVQFFISPDRNIASHAIFLDRLAYAGWDDEDSTSFEIPTDQFGIVNPLYFDGSAKLGRLQKLTMYLLAVLVRNHYPEAIGYPEPLHQADWGAKSMKRRVIGLLESSEWAFRARPLSKTFREIRDRLGR
jgi:hypothetical protein